MIRTGARGARGQDPVGDVTPKCARPPLVDRGALVKEATVVSERELARHSNGGEGTWNSNHRMKILRPEDYQL